MHILYENSLLLGFCTFYSKKLLAVWMPANFDVIFALFLCKCNWSLIVNFYFFAWLFKTPPKIYKFRKKEEEQERKADSFVISLTYPSYFKTTVYQILQKIYLLSDNPIDILRLCGQSPALSISWIWGSTPGEGARWIVARTPAWLPGDGARI